MKVTDFFLLLNHLNCSTNFLCHAIIQCVNCKSAKEKSHSGQKEVAKTYMQAFFYGMSLTLMEKLVK